jgi:hypothetical protein
MCEVERKKRSVLSPISYLLCAYIPSVHDLRRGLAVSYRRKVTGMGSSGSAGLTPSSF